MSKPTVPLSGTNLSILVGALSHDAEIRDLPSGDQVLSLDLTIRRDGTPAESVPVAWFDAPASAAAWSAGTEVLVIGRVRRRFFRAGGSTQSRTEVVATRAIPTTRAASATRALRTALDAVASGL